MVWLMSDGDHRDNEACKSLTENREKSWCNVKDNNSKADSQQDQQSKLQAELKQQSFNRNTNTDSLGIPS